MYYIKKYIALILTVSTILACCSCKKKSKVDYKDVNDLFNDIVNELQTNYEDYQDCWESDSLEIDSFDGKKVSFKVLKKDGFCFEGDIQGATGSKIFCPLITIGNTRCDFAISITTGNLNNSVGGIEYDTTYQLEDGSMVTGTIFHIGRGDCQFDDNNKLTSVNTMIYILPD